VSKAKPSPPPHEPSEADLPEGWCAPLLRDVLDVRYGKGLPEKSRRDGPYAVYGSNGVVGRHEEPLTAGPTIILGRKGTVGAVHFSPDPCWPIDTTYFIEERPGLDMGFLYYALSTLGLSDMDTSTAIPGLNRGDVFAKTLPLAPLAEQKRIMAKVEELLGRVNAARARLARLPAILKRFRQSVLAAACSGQLTAEWREGHGDAPPSDVDLPSSWERLPLRELCESFEYGSSRKSDDTGNVPVLRMGNLQDGKIDWSDLKYSSDAAEIAKYTLTPNTVLFNRTNSPELVGKTAIYRGERPAIFAGYLIRIVHGPRLNPDFLNYSLNTHDFREYCMQVKSDGVSQSNINAKKLASYEVALPPLAEQREIVRRVEALFARAERIEAHVRAATVRAERLPQAILARAFRGELVPTEAELARAEGRDYEPASVLLARIQEQREVSRSTKAKGKEMRAMVRSRLRIKESVTATVRRPLMNVFGDQKRRLTPEQLFQLAGFDESSVDEFYQQLRELVAQGQIKEIRPNKKDVFLEAARK